MPFLSNNPTVLLNGENNWLFKKFPKVSSLIAATTTPVNTPLPLLVLVEFITGYDTYSLGTLSFDSIKLL